MRRLFWLALGATLGVLIVRKVTRTAHSYTPSGMTEGLSAGLSDLGEGLREMAGAVREGMAEREGELRQALGMDTGTLPDGPAMSAERAAALIEDPTSTQAR